MALGVALIGISLQNKRTYFAKIDIEIEWRT